MDENAVWAPEVVHADTLPQALRSLAIGLWWIALVAVLPTRRLKAWAEEHIEALVDEIEERRCSR